MADHPRILPLVTATGPVCQEACPDRNISSPCAESFTWEKHHYCKLPALKKPCLPALREAWLREQERERQTCETCEHWNSYRWCKTRGGYRKADEGCREGWEERRG